MPRFMKSAAVVLTLLALIPLLALVKARVTDSDRPRLSLVYDMDDQSKVKSQRASELFADGRAMRPPPAGTVARDELVGRDHLRDGRIDTLWVETFPAPVTRAMVERGRERYGIYCAPCHGQAGNGDGIVAKRAEALMEGTWVPPSNLADATVRARPVGHLYNTIRHGIRKMPAYGSQIGVEDRWAIVAYVRALQAAQAGSPADLAPADLAALGPPPAAVPAPAAPAAAATQ
ncbi:MAG: cytochrome c [bacterium]|nr:cytochrome c [bacterium]